MQLLLTATMLLSGALQVWTESPAARVYPDFVAGKDSWSEVRLHAACGERESFQVCVRARGASPGSVALEGEAPGGGIGAPEIRCVGYLNMSPPDDRTDAPPLLFPDPLFDYEPMVVPKGETRAFWVTYSIPRDAQPGIHKGRLFVTPEKGPRRALPVTLVVFNFALPEMPSLRSLSPLNRKAVCAAYGIDDLALDSWKPVYDALGGWRLSYSVWDGGDLVKLNKTGADTSVLQEHLAYAVEHATMNTIDVGAGPLGAALFPPLPPDAPEDPLRPYLEAVDDWLQERGWLNRVVMEVCPWPERAAWLDAQRLLFRTKRADSRIVRLLTGPLNPAFEEYTEIWATPLHQYDLHAAERVTNGFSLVDPPAFSVAKVTASPSSADHPAGDACDGSLFTAWESEPVPDPEKPAWIEMPLRLPVKLDVIKIVWKNGMEPGHVALKLLREDGYVPLETITWTPCPPTVPFGQSWAEGRLEKPVMSTGVRLEFSQTPGGGPVGVTEIVLALPPEETPLRPIAPIETWLAFDKGRFPNLALDGHPVEARMLPWICYGHMAAGFVCREWNDWPRDWKAGAGAAWRDPGKGAGYLFYPGQKGPLASIRAETLRDGMEDYEYLVALESVVVKGQTADADLKTLSTRMPYPSVMPPEAIEAFAKSLPKTRNKIGWALDAIARKGTP